MLDLNLKSFVWQQGVFDGVHLSVVACAGFCGYVGGGCSRGGTIRKFNVTIIVVTITVILNSIVIIKKIYSKNSKKKKNLNLNRHTRKREIEKKENGNKTYCDHFTLQPLLYNVHRGHILKKKKNTGGNDK